MSKGPKPGSYHFHPLELSFLGYSGSGKTTLIEALIPLLQKFGTIGYIKHDAHSFEVDRPGKDSYRATAAGAVSSYIANDSHFACMGVGSLSLFQQKSLFLDADALLIEGYKRLDMDRIVVLDRELKILDAIDPLALERIYAFVGETAEAPRLPIDRPYFQRDALSSIADFILSHWAAKLKTRPLRGLVLAGGMSTRMGQDKGLLSYRGKPQAIHTLELLQELGIESYLSLRQDQWTADERNGLPIVNDSFLGLGPLGGILSAMHSQPEAAWLVLACDLPLLHKAVIENLLNERRAQTLATAYRSSSDGLPEPLCAIYEPRIRMRMMEGLGLGLSCPRKVLLNTHSTLLEPYDSLSLSNANTPEDYRFLSSQLALKEYSL